MTTPSSGFAQVRTSVTNALRIGLGLTGLVALIVGILILVWPARTAVVVTAIIAVYAVVVGIVYAAMTFFATARSGWWRAGHGLLAILFIAAGISAFFALPATAVVMAYFVVLMIGITWIMEGVVALTTIGNAQAKGWSAFYAVVSIIAGIVLLISPAWGAVVLWWIFGIALVVLGVSQIVRAFTLGRSPAA